MSVNLFGENIEVIQSFTESFLVPPFSVLDTKQQYWIKGKSKWKNRINDYGETRNHTLSKIKNTYDIENPVFNILKTFNVSILDPFLCEVLLKWYAFDSAKTFDPFAGDTSFGYVSAYTGHEFTGIELRQCQVDVNRQKTSGLNARYICDDAINVLNHIEEKSMDFLFSCPPYYDLEKYSDMPNDASNQKCYDDFLNLIDIAFSNAIKCLKNNRFACIVISDVRDKKGFYRRLPHHICDIFQRNGMYLYNEIILLDRIGRSAMTANRNFISRKNPRIHQNILVFFNGKETEIKNIYKKLR